jgi:EAL domain-containing protein (putative c-di-GMP-specific phosphodiesterase class I)
MGVEVTAEGIETPEELAAVRASGCSDGQGFRRANRWHVPSLRGRQPGAKQTRGPQRDVSSGLIAGGSEQVF